MDEVLEIHDNICKYHDETRKLIQETSMRQSSRRRRWCCDWCCFRGTGKTEEEIFMIKLDRANRALDEARVQIYIANEMLDFIESEPI